MLILVLLASQSNFWGGKREGTVYDLGSDFVIFKSWGFIKKVVIVNTDCANYF